MSGKASDFYLKLLNLANSKKTLKYFSFFESFQFGHIPPYTGNLPDPHPPTPLPPNFVFFAVWRFSLSLAVVSYHNSV